MSHHAAIGLMCLSVLCFSILDSTAKYLGEVVGLPIEQVLWVRFATHIAFLIVLYNPQGFISGLKSNTLNMQLLRTLSMVAATAFNFLALLYLQLDQTITLFFLSPLLVAALSGPILGEWLRKNQVIAILFGFLGVLIVTRPGMGGIHWAVIYALLATLAVSLYNVLTRLTSRKDNNRTNQIYSPLGGAIALTPFAFFAWQTPESLMVWGLLLSMGLSGGLGHWFLITAHHHAPAPLLAPFIYVGIITMPIIGYLVFDDVPSIHTLVGALCVISSGLYLWLNEKNDKKTNHQAPPLP